MLLKKKVLKILSVLVAVIIAFSCLCISASASGIEDYLTEVYFVVAVYDESGEIVDEHTFILEDMKFNSVKDFYYYDVPAPEGYKFFEPGTVTGLLFFANLPADFYVFNFSSGVSVLFEESLNFYSFNGFNVAQTGLANNALGDTETYESGAILTSSRPMSTFSFAFAPADYVFNDDGSLSVSGPKLQVGMFDFFSNINVFFKKSVSWFTTIFSKVILQPSLTVLIIGFVSVGFVFSLLYRFIRSK